MSDLIGDYSVTSCQTLLVIMQSARIRPCWWSCSHLMIRPCWWSFSQPHDQTLLMIMQSPHVRLYWWLFSHLMSDLLVIMQSARIRPCWWSCSQLGSDLVGDHAVSSDQTLLVIMQSARIRPCWWSRLVDESGSVWTGESSCGPGQQDVFLFCFFAFGVLVDHSTNTKAL